MDIICINDIFPNDTLKFYEYYNVETPRKDSLYTIRDVIINSNSKTGFLLEELVNPKVPIQHPIMGRVIDMEPNWDISRFALLDGGKITRESIREYMNNKIKIF